MNDHDVHPLSVILGCFIGVAGVALVVLIRAIFCGWEGLINP